MKENIKLKVATKIPYDIQQLELIQKNGIIANVSDLNFQHLPKQKQVQTALIYFHNTNTPQIELIFNDASYQLKQQFLIKYITSKFICNIVGLAETWMSILFNFENKKYIFQHTILSFEQIEIFNKKNNELCKNLLQVILSLPYFYINSLSKLQSENFNLIQNLEVNDTVYFNENLAKLISYQEITQLFNIDNQSFSYYNYIKLFNQKNLNLYNAIQKSPIAPLVYGMLYNKQLLKEIFAL